MSLIFAGQPSKRPTFADFNSSSKSYTIKFALACLVSATPAAAATNGSAQTIEYSTSLADTIKSCGGASNHPGVTSVLFDVSCECLSILMQKSDVSRNFFNGPGSTLTFEEIINYSVTSSNSLARKSLAKAAGTLLKGEQEIDVGTFVERCGLSLKLSKSKLNFSSIHHASNAHGAALLAGEVMKAIFFRNEPSSRPLVPLVAEIISCLGQGVAQSDQRVSMGCAVALEIACSARIPADILNPIATSFPPLFDSLTEALKKSSQGERCDPFRVMSVARATGLVLSATKSLTSNENVDGCVDALFSLLGSDSYKKQNEVALVAGEALAKYADRGGSPGLPQAELRDVSLPFDETYAKTLPPNQFVIYRILSKEFAAHNPQTRTASVSAIFSIVAHASALAGSLEKPSSSSFVNDVWSMLLTFQTNFVKALADPKSKQLSRECACRGLAACYGFSKVFDCGKSESSVEMNEQLLRAFGQTTNHGGSAFMETREQEMERRMANEAAAANSSGGRGGLASTSHAEGYGNSASEGGQAGVSEAALGAYREMAAAAVEVQKGGYEGDNAGGRNLLYYLICLSTTHVVWSWEENKSKYSAAVLLKDDANGGNGENQEALISLQQALRPHLKKLTPKLLRACNDPNAQTREHMGMLWNSLTGGKAEGRTVITNNLVFVVDELCKDAVNKLWRARVGACGALSDVIVGRNWEDLGGGEGIVDIGDSFSSANTDKCYAARRLLELWRVGMRALDDVRSNVRESGGELAKSLRSLTVRLCDPTTQDVSDRDAESATSTILSWILKSGLNQPCNEAIGSCISTLLRIVEVAKAATLQPILPQLINKLICSMSNLEPGALNYLQLRVGGSATESGERLENLRWQMAQAGPIGDALNKCVAVVKFSNIEIKREVVRELGSALRSSVGAVSRGAVAEVVNTLVTSSPDAFKSYVANDSCVKLLRALYFASERERGAATREKLTFALGNLSSLAPEGPVRVLIRNLCDNYERASASNGSVASKRAASGAVSAIAGRSPVVFADGGKADLFARRVLPIAWVGKFDDDEVVKKHWAKAWEEGGGAYMQSNIVDEGKFGIRLEERILEHITDAIATALKDVSWGARKAGCLAIKQMCESGILEPPSGGSNDSRIFRANRRGLVAKKLLLNMIHVSKRRLWRGKNFLLEAIATLSTKWESSPPEVQGVTFVEGGADDLFEGDDYFKLSPSADNREEEEEEEEEKEIGDDDSDDRMQICTSSDRKEGSEMPKDEMENDDKHHEDMEKTEIMEEDDQCATSPIAYLGLCRLLLDQANVKSSASYTLPYRVASLESAAKFIDHLSNDKKIRLWEKLSKIELHDDDLPPVLIAKRVGVLAALFHNGMSEDVALDVTKELVVLAKNQAWSVREASCVALGVLAEKCSLSRKIVDHLSSSFLHIIADRKYARCRASGFLIVKKLLSRIGPSGSGRVKELCLIYKEAWRGAAKKGVQDTDVVVTGYASEVVILLQRL